MIDPSMAAKAGKANQAAQASKASAAAKSAQAAKAGKTYAGQDAGASAKVAASSPSAHVTTVSPDGSGGANVNIHTNAAGVKAIVAGKTVTVDDAGAQDAAAKLKSIAAQG